MSLEDDLVATNLVMNARGNSGDAPIWSSLTSLKTRTPLLDGDGSAVAHYLAFSPRGYSVVNNNPNNPLVLEFSAFDHPLPDGPTDQFTNLRSKTGAGSMETARAGLWKALHALDEAAVLAHTNARSHLAAPWQQVGGSGSVSDFIAWSSQLPTGSYNDKIIYRATWPTWGTMDEFAGIEGAYDHCGATAAYNVVQYCTTRYSNLSLMSGTRRETFAALYRKIGHGPVLFPQILDPLASYFSSKGATLDRPLTGGWDRVKGSLDAEKMVIILLVASIFSAHYIDGIGWRIYSSGAEYVRVVDGWYRSCDRFVWGPNIFGSYQTFVH